MELLVIFLAIAGVWAAIAAYNYAKKKDVLEKNSTLLNLHGRNVVEIERLVLDLESYAIEHDVLDKHFMQGLTYRDSVEQLFQNRNTLMELKQLMLDYGDQMPLTELEANIRRMADNLNQYEFVRTRLMVEPTADL